MSGILVLNKWLLFLLNVTLKLNLEIYQYLSLAFMFGYLFTILQGPQYFLVLGIFLQMCLHFLFTICD